MIPVEEKLINRLTQSDLALITKMKYALLKWFLVLI